jgi:hypothetical protein
MMTYGWALLVIILVSAALFSMGLLNPAKYTKEICTGFQKLFYQEHKFGTEGSISVILANGVGQEIILTNGSWTFEDGGYYPVDFGPDLIYIPPEATFDINITGLPLAARADRYKGRLDVVYDTLTIQGQRDSGTCSGEYE